MSSNYLLDVFMDLFKCSPGDTSDKFQYEKEFHGNDEGTEASGSRCPSKSTSIYSIPSRDSMREFREEAAQRSFGNSFRSSSIFSCASSTPMQFTFDEYDMDEAEKIYTSTNKHRYGTSGNKTHPPDIEVTSTSSTAENSSILEMRMNPEPITQRE